MGSYSLQQQVFTLALLSNAASGHSAGLVPLESILTMAVQNFFGKARQYIGAWELAWGPVVAEPPAGTAAGNAAFVAKGTRAEGNPVYVLAIAGTNPISMYDVLTEDYDTTLVPFGSSPSQVGGPHVTQGTLDGINALRAMTDRSTGKSLEAYLAGIADPAATLVVTGHSLGGALAPALALSLFAASAGGTLDQSGWNAVRVCPIAGPTVGDASYTTLWASTFPRTSDAGGTWNVNVWNTIDIVPLAWANLDQLSGVYPGVWSECLDKIQATVTTHAAQSDGIRFQQPPNSPLQGSFTVWDGPRPVIATMVTYFLIEALHQHVWAYFDLLDVTEVRSWLLPHGDPLQQGAPHHLKQFALALVAANRCV